MIKLSHIPKRVWVNAPSTHQMFHAFHGTNGLAMQSLSYKDYALFFPISGSNYSMEITKESLSEGWNKKSKQNETEN